MATKTQFFCDKCGAQSPRKLPAYSLQATGVVDPFGHRRGSRDGFVECSRPQELCDTCLDSLLDALRAWGHSVIPRAETTIKPLRSGRPAPGSNDEASASH